MEGVLRAVIVPAGKLCVGRVLAEDSDWLTVEVAKHDDLTFTLQKNEAGETIGGDRFLTLLFIRRDADGAVVWKPWEDPRE